MPLEAVNGAVVLLLALGVFLVVLDRITQSPTYDDLED